MPNKWCLLLFLCPGMSDYFFWVVVIWGCINQSELTLYEKLKGIKQQRSPRLLTWPSTSSLRSYAVFREGSHRVFVWQKINCDCWSRHQLSRWSWRVKCHFFGLHGYLIKMLAKLKNTTIIWPHFRCIITYPAVGQHGRASLPREVHSEASWCKHFALLPAGQRSWNWEGRPVPFPRESVVEPCSLMTVVINLGPHPFTP